MSAEEAIKEGLRESDNKSVVENIEKQIEDIKNKNDILEKELLRNEELKAKVMLGGKALAGQPNEKTPEELANEEAKRMLSMFR